MGRKCIHCRMDHVDITDSKERFHCPYFSHPTVHVEALFHTHIRLLRMDQLGALFLEMDIIVCFHEVICDIGHLLASTQPWKLYHNKGTVDIQDAAFHFQWPLLLYPVLTTDPYGRVPTVKVYSTCPQVHKTCYPFENTEVPIPRTL